MKIQNFTEKKMKWFAKKLTNQYQKNLRKFFSSHKIFLEQKETYFLNRKKFLGSIPVTVISES